MLHDYLGLWNDKYSEYIFYESHISDQQLFFGGYTGLHRNYEHRSDESGSIHLDSLIFIEKIRQ